MAFEIRNYGHVDYAPISPTQSALFNDETLSLHHGYTPSAERIERPDGSLSYIDLPLICVSTATDLDWQMGRESAAQTWIYFKNRAGWRQAHRLARLLKKAPKELSVHFDEISEICTVSFGQRHSLRVLGARRIPHPEGETVIGRCTVDMRPALPRRRNGECCR